MTSFLVLTGAWILVGIPAIVAIVRERRSPDLHFARAMDALGHQVPAPRSPARRRAASVAKRRAQVTSATYLSAAVLLGIGLVTGSPVVLAAAVTAANLGTVYRISILRVRAVAAQRHAVPIVRLPPAPPEPPMVAILGPVADRLDGTGPVPALGPGPGPGLASAPDAASDERVVLIG